MIQSTLQVLCEDVLYRIFFGALPERVISDGCPLDITVVEPMNFSMVCRSWRAVVLAHPNLWGRLWIECYSYGSLRPSFKLFLTKWLQYSKTSPLNISLNLYNQGDEESDAVFRDIIDTTLAQQSRLEEFYVYIEDPHTVWPFTLQLSPTLTSLELHYRFDSSIFQISENPVAFLDFTSCAVSNKLQTLCVSGVVRWILPKHPYPALHLAVLLACPNVIELSIRARRCAPSVSSYTFSGKTALLPHTTILYIISENSVETIQLFNALRIAVPFIFCQLIILDREAQVPLFDMAFLIRSVKSGYCSGVLDILVRVRVQCTATEGWFDSQVVECLSSHKLYPTVDSRDTMQSHSIATMHCQYENDMFSMHHPNQKGSELHRSEWTDYFRSHRGRARSHLSNRRLIRYVSSLLDFLCALV